MDVHILCWHLKLIFAKRVKTTQGDVRMSDTVLPSREQLEVISRLQNRAIVRRNVQAKRGPARTSSTKLFMIRTKEDSQQRDDVAVLSGARRGHPNLEATPKNLTRDMVLNRIGKMCLIDDRKHVVAPGDAIRHKASVLEYEDMVLRIRNDRGLVLRYLHHSQTLEVDHGVRHCKIQACAP